LKGILKFILFLVTFMIVYTMLRFSIETIGKLTGTDPVESIAAATFGYIILQICDRGFYGKW
jgi:hypothetical protein